MYQALYDNKDNLRWILIAFAVSIPVTLNIMVHLQNDIFIALFFTLAIRKLIEGKVYQASLWLIAVSLFRIDPAIMLSPAIVTVIYQNHKWKGVMKYMLIMPLGHTIIGLPFLWANS